MQIPDNIADLSAIAKHLAMVKTIAVVGLSPKENRPSNLVGRYLLDAGFTVIPVNPGQDEILGQRCFADLVSIDQPVDVVDIFRKPEDVLPIVEEALRLRPLPKIIWMQQGIVNDAAAELARQRGVFVVMDRCIKIDHHALLDR